MKRILNETNVYSENEKLNALQNINKDKLNVNIQYNGSVCGPYMDYKTFKNMTPEELLQMAKKDFDIETDIIKGLEIYENSQFVIDGGKQIRIYLGVLELNNGENLEDYVDFRSDYYCETDEEFDDLIKTLQ